MSKSLDFNAIQKPTLKLTMKDDARTVVNVSAPSLDFVERAQALDPVIKKLQKGGDAREVFRKIYEFYAEVLSDNEDGLKVTADELRNVYKLSLMDLFALQAIYMEFIDDIKNAKN